MQGTGAIISLSDITFHCIPLYIHGGTIILFQNKSAITTTEIRLKLFNFIIAPGLDSTASGLLYLDNKVSLQ